MRNSKLFVAFMLTLPAGLACAEADANALKVNGYLKSIIGRSTTFIGQEQDYSVSQNRLRLQLQGTLAPKLAIDLQYDNEVMFGSYLDTAQFEWQKQLPSAQYWKAGSNYADRSDIHGRHRFYRASFTFSHGNTDIRFGRQRIAWGTGRFWSPLDILNPVSPTQLEREERPGVDAMLIEHKLGPLSRMSIVYAPQHEKRNASVAAQFHGNAGKVDYSIVWGKFQQAHAVGLDIATQLGVAGIRSELTYTRPGTGNAYRRALIGIDYAFANTLTLSAEWFYNGRGTADRANYDFTALLAGRVQSLARNYAGFYAGYEITPLLKWNNYLVLNLDDRSHYFSPSLAYSLHENLEWTVGLQQFGGTARAEYGRMPDFYYTQLKWFF